MPSAPSPRPRSLRLTRRRALALSLGAATLAGAAGPLSSLHAPVAHAARSSGEPHPDPDPDVRFARFPALAERIARANVVDGRPIPSIAYGQGTWLRDAYWTTLALRDLDLQRRTWQRFADAQNPSTGQVPTALKHSDEVLYIGSDESTALFLLLALHLRRAGVAVPGLPVARAGAHVLGILDVDARVRAGPGSFTWWLDTVILAQRDTVAYTQGVTAVALRALQELGEPLPEGLPEQAEDAYAGLYRPDLGTITLSAATTLLDVSCLVGEHLSLRLFQRPLLSPPVVAATLGSFRRAEYPDGAFLGFAVASQLDGSPLAESWFYPAPDNWPGYYHNGGSWLLYDAIALDAARAHGLEGAADLFRARIVAETRQADTLHEYIATDPARGHLGTAPWYWRKDYAWNSYVATLL